MKKLILILLCSFFVQNGYAFCPKKPIRVNITTNPGQVRYDHTRSRSEFSKFTRGKINQNTMGLTISELTYKLSGKSYADKSTERAYCVGVEEINFEIGYDEILVLIDKKYPENSCNYKVIKEHENYHVRVSQEAMYFFRKDIERKLQEALNTLQPRTVYTPTYGEQFLKSQFSKINDKMRPVFNHINDKIDEKNEKIDTSESYKATSKLCPKW